MYVLYTQPVTQIGCLHC